MDTDPQTANILFQITILLILTLINAFFAGSEMAVVSVNKGKIHRLAESGNKNAALIERLMEDSTVFLSTIQVAITLEMCIRDRTTRPSRRPSTTPEASRALSTRP